MHAQTMQDCTYSWMYTYAHTSTHYQMHTDIHQHGHTYRHALTITRHPSSPCHPSPVPCPSPGSSLPMPCPLHHASMSHCQSWPLSSPVHPLLTSLCPCPGRLLKQDGCKYTTHAHSTHTLCIHITWHVPALLHVS